MMRFRTVAACLFAAAFVLHAEPQHLDGISAVVGDSIILQSEVSSFVAMRAAQSGSPKPDALEARLLRKQAIQDIVDSKIMLVHAESDTNINLSTGDLEKDVDTRLNYILSSNHLTMSQLDSVLQKDQGMNLARFRKEIREQARQESLKQKVIQQYVEPTPLARSEVEAFFAQYKDSMPPAGASIRLSVITLTNSSGDSIRECAWAKISKAKTELDEGADFAATAKKYSEDPTAAGGGDLGFIAKGSLGDIRLEEEMFSQKPGKYSDPFETKTGFHIVKSEERREQMVHARQIFVSTAPPETTFSVAIARLDSIKKSCADSTSFVAAAKKFSTDAATRSRGGKMHWLTSATVPAEVHSAFDTLVVGQISKPVRSDRKISIYRIDAIVDNRPLTIEDDYGNIAQMAQNIDSQKRLTKLIERWRKETFVEIRE